MILGILKLILILIIVPICSGMIPAFFIDGSKRCLSLTYVMGFILSMAIFQLVAVPVIVLKANDFPLIVTIYSVVTALTSLTGVVLGIADIRKSGSVLKKRSLNNSPVSKDEIILWIFAIVLIAFQMVMFVCMQSFDGDDAYYVVESLLTYETDTLYTIKPYTGLTTSIDLRHALAAMPVWIAYIGRVSGIHSTIIAHSVIGIILIPVVYMIYYQCARILIIKDRKKTPIMLIFISIMYIFGNTSIYTSATFMLTRTWQGKAMLANMVMITIIWLLLALFETDGLDKENRIGYWICLVAVNIVAAMCSTASVFLVAMLIGISGLVLSILKRDIQILLKLIITSVPLVMYAAMYMLI